MSKRWVRLFLLLISTTAVFSRAAMAGEATWVEVKSPHFSVVTDAGERRGREVATRFEQMRAVFGRLLTQAKVNTPIPLQIVAFRNTKELRQVSPLWHGKPVELAGLFQGSSDRCFIMLDMSVESPWGVVFHEYAHQLMNGTLSFRMDPWFEEGFAEYFSSIEVDTREARVGKIPAVTYEIIQQRGLMKIADLFRVQQNSSTYNESGDKRTVFYAESSMVVHYIYDNDLFPKLANYVDLRYNKNLSVEDAIQQGFGMSAANFDKAIRSYIASNQFQYYKMKTPPEIETTGYTSKPISHTDASAVMADIHAHSSDYHEKSAAEFEDVLKADPANAAACRGLGYAYLQKQDFDKALEYFRRAVKADSTDARVHYYLGVLMNMKGSDDDSDLASVTSELKTSISLDPDFADAYMQLSSAQRRARDFPAALANAKKALSLNPRNQGYYFNIAALYMQERKTAEALSIFRALSKSSDPAIAQQASSAALQIQNMEAMMHQPSAAPIASESELVEPASVHPPASVSGQPAAMASPPEVPPQSSLKFLKGTIVSVDCSSAPAATLTVLSSGKNWAMQVRDSSHVLVMGADAFSCKWSQKNVALNYHETGERAGSVVSIEIQ
jgi:tetratricopeptide (TPR) repeat protein